MSFSRQVTIWCDGCSEWKQESESSATKVRRHLKRKGWTTEHRLGTIFDYCPNCSKKKGPSS